MITEIPSENDFSKASLNLLNLAWATSIQTLKDLRDADSEWVNEITTEYWEKCQPILGNALTLIQQAQEMAIKGRIASVSPYLLIMRDVRDWPKNSDKENASFSEFKTLDASDLVKVHDSVSAMSFDEDFKRLFNEVRVQRNQIIHQGRAGSKINIIDIVANIIKTASKLHSDKSWVSHRRLFLENDNIATAHSIDHVDYVVLDEFQIVTDLLEPAFCKKYLGFDKKTRSYICPQCWYHSHDHYTYDEDLPKLAKLLPNSPSSTKVYCLTCEQTSVVERRKCVECKGNVISDNQSGPADRCLSCAAHQS